MGPGPGPYKANPSRFPASFFEQKAYPTIFNVVLNSIRLYRCRDLSHLGSFPRRLADNQRRIGVCTNVATSFHFRPQCEQPFWPFLNQLGEEFSQIDDQGEVVLLAPTWDREAQGYSAGRFEHIESGLSHPAALAEQILVEVHAGFARSSVQLNRAFQGSLAVQQKQRLNFGKAVDEMILAGMLRIDRDEEELLGEETLVATRFGRVATRHLLRPNTILKLQQFLHRQTGDDHEAVCDGCGFSGFVVICEACGRRAAVVAPRLSVGRSGDDRPVAPCH